MKKITDYLKEEILVFDGGMGTLLQKNGMTGLPELYNISAPERIEEIHREYIQAGARVITANTFGANSLKYENAGELVSAGVACARRAAGNGDVYVALDIGPLGEILTSFDRTVSLFSEIVKAGCDADVILIETMTDIYEAKAAVIAAKEHSNKPIFCTMTLDEADKTMMGSGPEVIATVLEGLRVDAIGLNCGQGAEGYIGAVARLLERSSIPVMVQPNAGLPKVINGETVFSHDAEQFAETLFKMVRQGVSIVGGCCGTTPEHILALAKAVAGIKPRLIEPNHLTVACSYGKAVDFDRKPVIIGERLNPNGKKAIAAALRERRWDVLVREALSQEDAGARVIDVNAGLPGLDEGEVLTELSQEIQKASAIPLQIDCTQPQALEAVLRRYNGKAVLNSVCGKPEALSEILPIAAKYGAVVVALTLDEKGIPETAEERVGIARRIQAAALSHGIAPHDLLIDPLTLTAGAQQGGIRETLKAIKMLNEIGLKTVLGVSNVSFGLPRRELLNSTFLTMALYQGLNACIINPSSTAMLDAVTAANVLTGVDEGCAEYLSSQSASRAESSSSAQAVNESLKACVERGLSEGAGLATKALLENTPPVEIIESHIVPALQAVGERYELGKVFLPQLMQAAHAAQSAFAVLQEYYEKNGDKRESRGRIMMATVRGDIHDIGKNIVITMVRNFGFEVIDLGRDVPEEEIAEAVMRENIDVLGLSALMTTTVPAMERTIAAVRAVRPTCKIMVGGAVLNEDYAAEIGADAYLPDAMATIKYLEKLCC